MTKRLHLDFESRATVDLRKTGVRPYVQHPDTDIWMACWAIDDGPVHAWYPGQELPDELRAALEDPGTTVVGHSVQFEWNVIEHIAAPRYGWPRVPPERLDCTAARAARMSLPRSLDGASQALGLRERKDGAGHRQMLRMARPRGFDLFGNPFWWDDPDKVARLAEYCRQDVEVERALDKVLAPIAGKERKIWLLDFEINHLRGVKVDVDLVEKTKQVLTLSIKEYNQELAQVTGGRVKAVTNPGALLKWVRAKGVEAESLDKEAIVGLLGDSTNPLPEDVRRALEIRQEAGKSSTAKLQSFIDRTAADGRTYDTLLYHGAGTGRWAGAGIQLHNLPRPELKKDQVAKAIEILSEETWPWVKLEDLKQAFPEHSVPAVIASCLRGMLVADKGHRFLVSDFSNIEGRGNAWNADQKDKIELFREDGPIYERMGAKVFGIPVEEVTKDSLARFVGKQLELGAGYGMGDKKFDATCEGYGVKLEEGLATASINTFRTANDRIVLSWYEMEEAALTAVQNPGYEYEAEVGKVSFWCSPSRQWLTCKLPSGRHLYYPWPEIQMAKTPWGSEKEQITYMGVNSYTKKWERLKTYGGKLCENVVQAIARDVLAASMMRLEQAGYRTVLTVHDEIVAEVPDGFGSQEEFDRIMSKEPPWAPGFPIAVEGFEGVRYRK